MSLEENKTLARRLVEEGFCKGGNDILDKILADDVVLRNPFHGDICGLEAVKQVMTASSSIFPDMRNIVNDLIAEGDRVAVRATGSATHKGEWMGLAATNKSLEWEVIAIVRIADGKIVDLWQQWDRLTLFEQLGVSPPVGGD